MLLGQSGKLDTPLLVKSEMQCSAIYDATLLVLKNTEEKQGKYEEYEGRW